MKKLIKELKEENEKLSKELESGTLSKYHSGMKSARFNHNLEFIKKLEALSIIEKF